MGGVAGYLERPMPEWIRRRLSRPEWMRWLLNLYPPYLGAGVRVRHIAGDFREIVVEMPLRWYNRNYVGTHFGGSLYSMVDPFYMLMLIQVLGSNYVVWDQAAEIVFEKPGRGRVRAHFRLRDEEVDAIRRATETGAPHRPEFEVTVEDEAGEVVARVRKTLYVRRKGPAARAAA